MMFEIYKEKVEIKDGNGNTDVYELIPLGGDWYVTVNRTISQLVPFFEEVSKEEQTKNEQELLNLIQDDTFKNAYNIVVETFIKSYPTQKKEVIEPFVSQNLFKLLLPILQLNTEKNVN